MNGLIGEWQQRQVAGLVETLSRLRIGEKLPRAVVLEGESGSGKSRIVREVYSLLRTQQPGGSQGYWPGLSQSVLVKEDGAPDLARLEKARKVIGPRTRGFQRPPGTLPSFFWWSMNCGMTSDGSLIEVAAALTPQLSAHLPYLAEQWRTGIQGNVRLKRFLKQAPESAVRKAQDLKGDFTLETLGQVLTALEFAAPGYGTVLTEIWRGGEALREKRSRTEDVRRGGPLSSGEEGAKEIVRQLTRFGSPQLPIVLVIEDMHLMSAGLAELLDLLVQPADGFPVLILGTAVGFAGNSTWTRWRSATLELGLAEVRSMPAMSDAERSELTIQFGLSGNAANLLRKYENPWALILAMAHPKLGGRLRRGEPLALDGVPESVQEFYRTQWRALEEPVREVLVVTAAITDSGHQEVLAKGVASTASKALRGERKRYDLALAHAVDPCAWLEDQGGTGSLLTFGDPYRYQVAHLNASDRFDDVEVAAIGSAYAATINQWLADNAGQDAAFTRPSVRAAARKLLEDLPGPTDDPALVRLAAGVIADAQAAVLDSAGAVETWDRYVDPTTINWDDVNDLRDMHTMAARVWASGDLDRGIEMLDQVVTHRDALLGRRHVEAMAARKDLATWYAEVGEYRRAIRIGEALLEDQTACYGPRAEQTLLTRWDLATWYGKDYKYRKAIESGEALLEDSKGIWRRDDRDLTLLLRSHIAYWYGCIDEHGEAVELYAALLRDRQVFLGFDDEDTLNTRSNLAINTGYAGHPEQAAAQLDALVPDLEHVLGAEARKTLLARHDAAYWHGHSGAHRRAIQRMNDVLRRQERHLGVDHEDVLRTRGNLAELYEETGQRDKAIRTLEVLVNDCFRVLGRENPHTWLVVSKLAELSYDEGQIWVALRLVEQLAVGRTEILEETSHEVVSSERRLATLLSMTGSIQRSIPMLEQAFRACARTFGAHSVEALEVRLDLALAHLMAGHVDYGMTLLQALSRDIEHWFGADAASEVKDDLATWDRVREALDPASLETSLRRVPTATDFFGTAVAEGSHWVSAARLMAGCQAVGLPAMISAAASQQQWARTPQAAWLELVDSGYDPWRVSHWWMIWASALKAALDAVEDEDPEDLRLILQLNTSMSATYGPALRLLTGAASQTRVQNPAHTAEALDHIATWVIPETPLGERARLLAEDLA